MGLFAWFENRQHEEVETNSLHIDLSKGKIGFHLSNYSYVDKDTKQHVVYLPALQITGYGETVERAQEMLNFSVEEFCKYLLELTPNKISIELSKLGFKKDRFRNKDYSKSFVDATGELQNFNAENGKIEKSTLVAA